ncbi:MAG: DMT family transporter [Alphaproteobacteria bacterium]|nr:DMT family transporter [Alphaproteobacteria bacterium]
MTTPAPLATAPALALAAAIAAPLVWSIGGVVMRSVATAGPWEQVFWRAVGGGIAVAIALALSRPRAAWTAWRQAGATGWVSAVCIAGTFIVHVLAINATTVANVLFLQTANPLLVPILARLFLGERLEPRMIGALALAVAGLTPIVAASAGGGRLGGDLLALACAGLGAVNILVVRRGRTVDMTPAIVVAALLTLAVAGIVASPSDVAARDVAALVLLGVVQIAVGLWLFLFALRRLPAAPVALLTLLEPIIGPLLVWLVVAEVPPAATLAGGAVVLVALALCALVAARPAARMPSGTPT